MATKNLLFRSNLGTVLAKFSSLLTCRPIVGLA